VSVGSTADAAVELDVHRSGEYILGAAYLLPESADFIQPGLAVDIETPSDVPAEGWSMLSLGR
jgi:hypothetical protein